jgi:hypothetical protein
LQEAVRGDGCRKAGQGAVRARRFADIALPRHEFIQGEHCVGSFIRPPYRVLPPEFNALVFDALEKSAVKWRSQRSCKLIQLIQSILSVCFKANLVLQPLHNVDAFDNQTPCFVSITVLDSD